MRDLYNLEAQRVVQGRLLQGHEPRFADWELLPFVSPPFVAIALAPFTRLTLPAFYLLSGVIQLTLIAALVLVLQRAAADWPQTDRLALAALTVVWLPVSWALLQGQTSVLLALSLATGYLAIRSRCNTLGGFLLSLLWIKPQYAILVLPALLVWQNWRAAMSFVATSFGLLAVSWLAVGTQGLITYARLLTSIEGTGSLHGMFPAFYNTLSGVLVRFTGESALVWFGASFVLVAATLWYARRGFGPASFAALILATVLASLHTHSYDLVILLPVVALGWDALKDRPNLAAGWAAMWFATDVTLFVLAVRGTQFQDAPLATVPAMLLALAVLLVPKYRRTSLVPVRA
jgi:alpha-1,2-mannosyltransferase